MKLHLLVMTLPLLALACSSGNAVSTSPVKPSAKAMSSSQPTPSDPTLAYATFAAG